MIRSVASVIFALLFSATLFIPAVSLSGGGHGWNAGGLGCLALMPVSAVALWNLFIKHSSRKVAKATLIAGLCVVAYVVLGTAFSERRYFMQFLGRTDLANGLLLVAMCFHWAFASAFVLYTVKPEGATA
jgi:hypothetical protein